MIIRSGRTKAAGLPHLMAILAWAALAWATLAAAAPVAASSPAPASGQFAPANPGQGSTPNGAPRFGAAMDARLDDAEARLRATRMAIRTQSADDATLEAARASIAPIQADVADALATLMPRLDDVGQRLAELGPGPAAGQPPEAPDVAAARARLL
jgi:small-conductance mechanosensitive channel